MYPELRKLLLRTEEFRVFPDSRTLSGGDDWKWLSLNEKFLSNNQIKKSLDLLDINTFFGFYPFISKLEPNSYIAPHCGSTTFRHRIHLGISIPEPKASFIKVDSIKYHWRDGKAFIFDDSLIHEVKHDGNLARVVLIIDIWPNSIDKKTRKFLEDNFFWRKNLATFSNI
ncbi:aspartyl/asparaginyl beta-hydroxylase domain-containing protein [Candidatus Pseudothioglobus singularis]|nr:aspartyl/asparaginyl beta-hydroxylase domain-containing protein [Candidatus Pseudothioglobus singularis]